jgi:hypothetical protein
MFIDLLVVIGVEAHFLSVKRLGAIHIRDGHCHKFEFHIHKRSPVLAR